MKKILSLILALVAIATTAGAQTKFGLEVGGVQVTSANFSNITGGDIKSGTVTYHPTNKKLTLRDVTIIRQAGSGRRGIYNEKIGDLTIVFEGTNTITSDHSCALRCDAPTTLILSENSKTTFRENYSEAFYLTNGTVGRLVIQGSDTGTGELILEAPNEYAIEGEKGTETIRFTKAPIVTLNSAKSSLVNLGAVIFDRSASGKTSVTLAAGSGSQTVKDVQNWGTVGTNHIETPIGATFDTSKKTIVLNGEAVTGKVVVYEDVIPLDNNTKIPDANFRAYLKEKIAGGRNYLTYAEAQQVTSISVSEKKIANLKGIEFFTALTYLNCDGNQLTSLDVSKNTALKTLYCGKNQLTLLNVSGCTALKWLQCYRNQLTALNVSNNTELTILTCYGNQIKGDNMLALVNSLPKVSSGKFDVIYTNDSNEGNVITKPQVAIAKGKGWKVADVSNHNDYEGSDPGIAINDTNFPDENFRSYVSANTIDKDTDGYLSDAEIAAVTEIDVNHKKIANLKGIEFFTALKKLECYYNQLTSLNVSGCTALEKLYCNNNQLTSLDVSKNAALIRLDCYRNQLTSLDVSKNTALTALDCHGNQLTSLDVSKNTALKTLACSRNQLTSLDVSKNTALKILYCDNNQLTLLDVSKNTALTGLDCRGNQLTALDVSKNTALFDLWCFGNQIKGDKMQALVNSLPKKVSSSRFYVIDTKDSNEGNVITKSQVAIAKGKNWKVYDYNGGGTYDEDTEVYVYPEYEGSDDPTTGLTAVESGQLTVDSWYSIDGKKLQGEPTKKGVYINKGKKVVK